MADQWNNFWRGHLPPQQQQQPPVNRQYEPWQGQQSVQSTGPRPLMKYNVQCPFQPRQSIRHNVNRPPPPRPLNRNYSPRNVHPPTIDQTRLAGFEAEKRFTNSKERIHNVLQNATKTHHKLNYRYHRDNSQIWKATVGVPWPSSYFEVTGEGFDKKQAERRAAALALLRLEEMGYPVGSTGTSIISKQEEIHRDDEPEEIQIPECVMSRIEPLLDISKLTMEKITSKNQGLLSGRSLDQKSPEDPQTCPPAQPSPSNGTKEIRDVFTGSILVPMNENKDDVINKKLLKELSELQKSDNAAMQQIREMTDNLPAAKMRDEVVNLINDSQVVLISGETGCGKTTQIPQFVLDNAIKKEKGSSCNIVVTQPRRIVAMSIAERVAKERGEELGNSVGYQVRLESRLPTRPGRILFCTTGVLLRKLQSNPLLTGVSHVIVDEVHERDINTDFLLVLLKGMIDTCPSLKVVVMSATIDSHRFCEYFRNCPQLNIAGFTHPVTEYFLDDVKQLLPPKPGQEQQWLPGDQDSKRFKPANDVNAEIKALPDVDPHLATDVILHVSRTYQEGAILCFLSGWDEIMTVYDLLLEKIPQQLKSCYCVLPLHSMIPLANQNLVFDRPSGRTRKIILATNIAETSITINDVVYVINAGNVKEKTYDEQKKVSCLGTHWCSKASITQRRGRAGRCRPGYCFNLFTRKEFEEMESYQKPEMLRMSLEEIVLQSKIQNPDCTAEQFLAKALDPPSTHSVRNAVDLLKDIGALDDKEKLTVLGGHMANLPVDPKVAKMIIYATVFRCVDPVLTIAAALSYRDPFLSPVKKRAEADKTRGSFARGLDSDHVALLNAYEGWVESTWTGNEREYINKNFLHRGTLNMIQGMRNQLYYLLSEARLVPNDDTNLVTNMYSRNLALVRAVLSAGLYPNVIKVGLGLESKGRCGKKRLKTTLRTKNDGRVAIHPSSVNVDKKNFNTKWLIYYEKVKSTQVFIRDSSTIHPVALLLFAGMTVTTLETPSSTQGQSSHVTLAVDGDRWMGFLCSPRAANTLQSLRIALENMVNQSMDTTRSHEVFEFNTKLIESVTTLLDRTYHTRVNDKR